MNPIRWSIVRLRSTLCETWERPLSGSQGAASDDRVGWVRDGPLLSAKQETGVPIVRVCRPTKAMP